MPRFCMEIADCPGEVETLFDSTRAYFHAYLTDKPPLFFFSVTQSALTFEQAQLDAQASREGLRPRRFTDPFLERASIQRAFADFLLPRDVLLLHGSAVAVDDHGYLFTAKTGTGKSTHTRLWRQLLGERAEILNDDRPFVALRNGGAILYGSPWSGKHGLHANRQAPLKGICLLTRGLENHICPLRPADALPTLLREGFAPTDPQLLPRYQAGMETLAQSVPLWLLRCNQEPEAARVSYQAMSGVSLTML